MQRENHCLTDNALIMYLNGTLDEKESVEIERHVLACLSCRTILHDMMAVTSYTSDAMTIPAVPNVSTSPQSSHSAADSANSIHALGAELPIRFALLRKLGDGGMGDVWKAVDCVVNREVAIKFLRPHASGLQETQRLLNEAIALGRFSHPGIVQIHEVLADLPYPAIVMELIDGPDLSTVLHGCAAPNENSIATLLCKLCSAVAHAHSHGVVHRDLKPSNVLLRANRVLSLSKLNDVILSDYEPVLTDFGVARFVENQTVTQAGQILGTPAYMAPEVANAESIENYQAVDIYGLGSILYSLLTGRAPHGGENAAATLVLAQRGEVVAPRLFRSTLSPDLETICLKCLSRIASDRYGSADLLRMDLQAFLENRPVKARGLNIAQKSIRWARRHPIPTTLMLLLALAFGIICYGCATFVVAQSRNRERATHQLGQAVALIEIFLGNLRSDTRLWQMIRPDQRTSIYQQVATVYREYLQFHCADRIIPEQHLLYAVRLEELELFLEPTKSVDDDFKRIEASLAAIGQVRLRTREVFILREYFAQTKSLRLKQSGSRAAAAAEMMTMAAIVREQTELAKNAPDASFSGRHQYDWLRQEVGCLMSAATDFSAAEKFPIAAAVLCQAAERLLPLVEREKNENDLANYLVIMDSAAKNHLIAGNPSEVSKLTDKALRVLETYPIHDTELKFHLEPIQQSLCKMSGIGRTGQ